MKYKITHLVTLILFTFLAGRCNNKTNENEEMYRKILSSYPKELIVHFPKLDMKNALVFETVFPEGTYANNWNGIHLITKTFVSQIFEIEQNAKNNAVAIMSYEDTCNYIINYNDSIYKDSPFKLHACKDSSKNSYPIPNFLFCKDMNDIFFKSSTIYVLNAKSGEFLKHQYLTENGVGLSKDWKHGYSKGLVINKQENIVVYWLEVW